MRPTPCHSPRASRGRGRGVTLIEMIIVISITAIIAGVVAVFISRPVESYADATRRAELTDIADTALRRITRDLRTALPNSIRIAEDPPASGILYLEFLPVIGGGRYRTQPESGGGGDALDFSGGTDGSFDVIGTPPAAPDVGDLIVIYNLSASGAVANAYSAGGNSRAYANLTGSTITYTPNTTFPFASPGNRFQVVRRPVTYECNPSARTLRRHWDYPIALAQPTTPAGLGTTNALLAGDIAGCIFVYQPGGASTGIVQVELRIERPVDGSVELIRLFQQVHVNNVP